MGGYRLEDRGEVYDYDHDDDNDDDDDHKDDHDEDKKYDDKCNHDEDKSYNVHDDYGDHDNHQVSVKGKGAMITFWLVGEEPALRAARFLFSS